MDDSFRPNGGYSETCDFDKQKKVDVSVNNWIRRVPPEAVTAHMNIAKQQIAKIPSEKELVIAG